MVFNSVKHAKLLLLGGGKCMECKHAGDIWFLADNLLKCAKTKNKVGMEATCPKWKKTSDDEINKRWYYFNKYIADRKFINMVKRMQEEIDEWKKQTLSMN